MRNQDFFWLYFALAPSNEKIRTTFLTEFKSKYCLKKKLVPQTGFGFESYCLKFALKVNGIDNFV